MSQCPLFATLVVPAQDCGRHDELLAWRASGHLERCEDCRAASDRLRVALSTLGPPPAADQACPLWVKVSDLARVPETSLDPLRPRTPAPALAWRGVALLGMVLVLLAGSALVITWIPEVTGLRAPDSGPQFGPWIPLCLAVTGVPLVSLGVLVPFFVSGLFGRDGQCLA